MRFRLIEDCENVCISQTSTWDLTSFFKALTYLNRLGGEFYTVFFVSAPFYQEDPQTAMSLGKSERDFLIVNPSTNDKITSVSKKGRVTLREDLDEEGIIFAKYAISNALAQSVKLGVWEQMLETYIDSIEHIAEDLRMGRDPKLTQRVSERGMSGWGSIKVGGRGSYGVGSNTGSFRLVQVPWTTCL